MYKIYLSIITVTITIHLLILFIVFGTEIDEDSGLLGGDDGIVLR